MKAPRRLLALLLTLTLLGIPVALAGEHDEEEGDEMERSGKEKREVRIEREGETLVFEIKNADPQEESEVKISFDPSEGKLDLTSEFRNGTDKIEMELEVEVREIIEYADTNGNDAYDAGADAVLSSFEMDDLSWSVGDVMDVTFAGKPAKSATANGQIPGSEGSLAFAFYAAGDFTTAGGLRVTPDDVKFDVLVTGYPYATPLSRLALVVDVHEKNEHKLEDDDKDEEDDETDGAAVVATAPSAAAYFKWAETATVDGVDTPVVSTVALDEEKTETKDDKAEAERKATVTLNYAHGEAIVHDPVIGVQAHRVAEANTPGPGLFAFVLAIAAVSVVLSRNRR